MNNNQILEYYTFNQLSKENQDKLIDKELDYLLTEIFYLNIYEFPEDIEKQLNEMFEISENETHIDFVENCLENNLIYNYFRDIVINSLKNMFFVKKLQKHNISNNTSFVALID